MFVSAASFSGAPDIASNPVVLAGAAGIIGATAVGLDGVEPDAMFGDPVPTDQLAGPRPRVAGHQPRRTPTLSCGRATACRDRSTRQSARSSRTRWSRAPRTTSTLFFAQAARQAHIAYTFDDYGRGTHSWPYWTRDLAQYLPR